MSNEHPFSYQSAKGYPIAVCLYNVGTQHNITNKAVDSRLLSHAALMLFFSKNN